MAILRSFSEYLFYRTPMGNCLLLVEVEEFQPPTTDSVKSYFTNAFQAFYTKTRSIHSKALFSQNPFKLSVKKLICKSEVVRYQSAGLRKKLWDTNLQVYEKNSFTHPLSCILPSCFQNASRLLLQKRLWKCGVQFLLAESSVTCNLPVQSRFI